MQIELTAMFETDDNGLITAWLVEIPAMSQGRTHEEARTNLRHDLERILQSRRKRAADELRSNPNLRSEQFG